jgi:hypothetical protein
MMDDSWTSEMLVERAARGSHQSTKAYIDFVREEMADFDDKSFWTVLPLQLAKEIPNLRLSPLGCVPQHDRRPRLINDLSFYAINQHTVCMAPPDAMQFGRALERVLHKIKNADPRHGPVYLCKIDIADGFYRVDLEGASAPTLAVILPYKAGEEPLVAIPLALPMGWVESPPYFCAVTETIADIANRAIHTQQAPHRLDDLADTSPPTTLAMGTPMNYMPSVPLPMDTTSRKQRVSQPTTPETSPPTSHIPSVQQLTDSASQQQSGSCPTHPATGPPMTHTPPLQKRTDNASRKQSGPCHHNIRLRQRLAYIDIYVDDFLALCQGSQRERTLIRRVLLHAIDCILAPLDPATHPQHNEPTSVKKLKKGDACWSTTKIMLGWLIDTVAQTITLPPHRVERLLDIFDSLRDKKRVSLKNWHGIIGELRSMVLAIPGGRGLFSALQHTLTLSERNRVRITQDVRDALDDFEILGCSIAARPTRLGEIVPDAPSASGAHDASGTGAGGIWFTSNQNLVWREHFPAHIASQLVSSDNPRGVLTNSDFEQAGGVWHHMLLANEEDIREKTVHSLCDNTPAVSRFNKGSTTTKGAPAYLNRLLALHQRTHRYLSRHDYIPGPTNAMADDASRLWNLDDDQFLTHFNQSYPQLLPWKLARLPSQLVSQVIFSLQSTRSPMPLLPVLPLEPPQVGLNGHPSVTNAALNHSYVPWPTPSHSSLSLLSDTATAPCPKAASLSDLKLWMTSSGKSARRWPFWGVPTLESFHPASSISV